MREAYASTDQGANSGSAETGIAFSVSGRISPLQLSITEFFKTQYPRKTWAFLCDLLGIGERVAKHRIANTRAYTIEELQVMLQSDDGLSILERLMADAEPAWWWWAKQVMAQADKRRLAAEITQECLQLEARLPPKVSAPRKSKADRDASSKFAAAAARAETALGFLRPVTDRAAHSALVQAKEQITQRGGRR